MPLKSREKPAIDLVDKGKVKKIIAELADGKLKKEVALEYIIKIMDDYADKAIISFLEVEDKSRE